MTRPRHRVTSSRRRAAGTSDPLGAAYLADGPVWWARGNGTTADETGGTAGTLIGAVYGGAILTARPSAQSFSCDGVDDYVSFPAQAKLNFTSPLTIEAWVRPASTSVGFHQIAGTANHCIERSGNAFTLYTQGSSSLIGTTPITAGQTYHVAGVWNGTTAVLYVNGVAENTYSPVVPAASNVLRIGSYNGSSEFLDGLVAEAAVYNKALTAARIAAHYTAGTTAP